MAFTNNLVLKHKENLRIIRYVSEHSPQYAVSNMVYENSTAFSKKNILNMFTLL